jgi:hypothetical protein
MSRNAKWIRVSLKDRCAICGKHDWCDYSPELGLALCMRIESDWASKNSMGGWIHKLSEPFPIFIPKIVKAKPIGDFERMLKDWSEQTDHYHLDGFAMSLGVDTDALVSLGCAWSESNRAWAFPMRDSEKNIIGLRFRNDSGKWAMKGSSNGLFIPDVKLPEKTLWIVEGPTDTAAALTLGLNAIGRPSCSACDEMVKEYVKLNRVNRAVIITDNDWPDRQGRLAGIRGAEKLQRALPIISTLWIPPCKDLREFVRLGGSRQLLESSLKDLVWGCAA